MQTQSMTVSNISYQYQQAPQPLFQHLSATFPLGWTALLGDNGIGKTILMLIMSGELKPSSGTITPVPDNLVIAYCTQQTDSEPDNLDDFAADWSPETTAIRDVLGIGDDWASRFDSLSGGEAKRLQIACSEPLAQTY